MAEHELLVPWFAHLGAVLHIGAAFWTVHFGLIPCYYYFPRRTGAPATERVDYS